VVGDFQVIPASDQRLEPNGAGSMGSYKT